jgi:type I restriction-modification system DNA methylase subunit
MARPRSSKTSNSSANIGFEAKLWLTADSRSEAETPEGNRSGNMYATTRRLAMMNLAIRGIEADLGEQQADTFRRDLHPDLRADFVLANLPFNPAERGTNFAWVRHFIHHLAPGAPGSSGGMAGFVLPTFFFWE